MDTMSSRKLSGAAEARRIAMLFAGLPSSIIAELVGILLCLAALFDTISLKILQGWATYMFSVLAARICLWYMFGKTDGQSEHHRRWEWMYAAGAILNGIGWGALFGPLYPPATHPDAQTFVMLSVLVIAFTGAVFLALSDITFWLFIIPVLLPAFAHYALVLGGEAKWTLTASVCCMAALILVQRTLYRAAADGLQRSTEAESLLAEQQAIFKSSPMGIAVIDDTLILKCNMRLGELLGRRIQELTNSPFLDQFVSTAEADQFLVDTTSAFHKGELAQGMYRLARADGTEFWAEISGRTMTRGTTLAVWTIADATARVSSDRRAPISGAHKKKARR